MTPIQSMPLVLIVPVLCATNLMLDGEPRVGDRRYELEMYVHQLTAFCDLQIEEIASAIASADIEALHSEHYAWKLNRDIYCAEAGLNSSDELGELNCLAEWTEEYFERRDVEIAEIEARENGPPTAE